MYFSIRPKSFAQLYLNLSGSHSFVEKKQGGFSLIRRSEVFWIVVGLLSRSFIISLSLAPFDPFGKEKGQDCLLGRGGPWEAKHFVTLTLPFSPSLLVQLWSSSISSHRKPFGQTRIARQPRRSSPKCHVFPDFFPLSLVFFPPPHFSMPLLIYIFLYLYPADQRTARTFYDFWRAFFIVRE